MSREFSEPPFRRRSDVRFRIIDGEAVVLRQEAGETLVINEVGARILQLLDRGEDLEEVAEKLVQEFEVEPERVLEDVHDFAQQLVTAGVVETGAATGPERGDGAD